MADVNILVVEDESISAMDIKKTLESFGYKIPYVASSGNEAIEKMLEIMPDLILLDIILKGEMDGIKLASKIKEHDIPFIFLTAHSEESIIKSAMATDPYGYILKPYDENKLRFSIEHALYRKKMEDETSKQITLTKAINKVLKKSLESESPYDVAKICLEVAEELTDSKSGFIGEINPNGRFDTIAISDPGWAECIMPQTKAVKSIVNMEIRGYWARALKTGKSVIVNDPKSDPERLGEPEGHPPINSFLAVPLNQDDETIGMIALANKKSDYNSEDLYAIETLSVSFLEALERKKTEIELLKNEERFRAVAESAVDAIVTTGVHGIIKYFNQSLEEIFGYHKEELTGKSLTILMPERYREKYLQELEKFKESGEHRLIGKTVVTTGLKKDGTEFPFEMSLASWKSGEITFFTSIIRDLSEKKEAEAALVESEQRLADLIDFLPDATFAIDGNGRVISWNRATEEITGVKTEEIMGKGNYEYAIPFYGIRRPILVDMVNLPEEKINNQYRIPERKGEVLTAETDVTLKGEKRTVWAKAVPLYDSKGNFAGAIEAVRDITEMKESRRKINRELEINKSLANIYAPLVSPLSTIEDVSWTILHEAKKLTQSPHGFVSLIDNTDKNNEKVTLIAPGSMEGPVLHLTPDSDGVYNGMWGYVLNTTESFFTNTPQKHPAYSNIPKKHIDIDNMVSVPVYLGEDLVGQITMINSLKKYSEDDISAIERLAVFYALAIQNKRAEEEIKQSLKDKKILLREIHHRVKNNMQIISSLLNLQIRHVNEEKAVNILKDSQGRVKSMAMIHEKLYQSTSFTRIDLKDYVEALVSNIFFTYGINSKDITTEIDVEDIEIGLDTAIPCGLIINELVTNCVKHAFPENTGSLMVKIKPNHDNIKLVISDDGIGFPEDLDYKNTDSLGLKLVKNLAEQIDGQITMDNANGTTFKIIFQEIKYEKRI